MPRCFTLALVVLMTTTAWCQEDDDSRKITRIRQQVFTPLGQLAPSGNAGMFVGVNEFTHDAGLSKLEYAVHDAVETAYLFAVELKLIRPDHCYLLLSGKTNNQVVQQHLDELTRQGAKIGKADRTEILRQFIAVSRLANKESDLLVCSFSSHGFEGTGDGYVMPADGFRDLLAETAVPLKSIELNMEKSRAGHRLLLVDACQERVAARGTEAGDPAGLALISALQVPSGQAKLASCSAGEFSYENSLLGGVGHGVFTWAFLEALRGGAIADERQLVRLGSVADYVAVRVSDWTKENRRKKQTPFLKSPVETRNLPLAEKADDLTTLIASLKRQPASGGFTVSLRDELADYLGRIDVSNPKDRELLATTRDFVNDKLRANLFAAFVNADRARWRGGMAAEGSRVGEVRTFNEELKLAMVWCPAGRLTMGSPSNELGRGRDEHQLNVAIDKGFWIGQTEVTQHQWKSVMQSEPWRGKQPTDADGRVAASYIGWQEADTFCRRLTDLERQAGRLSSGWAYRLPSEAQWEYACRAETSTAYSFGDDPRSLSDYGWFRDNATASGQDQANAVGQRRPNPWNIFDMHGNVAEWCRDAYRERYDPQADPASSQQERQRAIRGGAWNLGAEFCRAAARNAYYHDLPGSKSHGFRVVLDAGE